MISIKVNGQFLELYPSTKINLKLNSPIFADGNIIRESYSIPFDIPIGKASETNSKILGHPDVIENAATINKYDAELFIDKVLYNIGQLKVTAISDTALTANFVYGFQTLSESVKEKTLRDIITGSIVLFSPTSYTKQVDLNFDIENTDIPITINGFTYSQYVSSAGELPTSLVSQINAESSENNCVASVASGKLRLVPNENPTDVNTPFNIIGDDRLWDVDTNISAYNALINAAIDPYFDEGSEPNDIIRFPRFVNKAAYTPAEHDTQEVNANLDGVTFTNIPGGSDFTFGFEFGLDFKPFNVQSLCPMVKLSYIIAQLETHFGITFSGNFIGSNWHNKGLLFNTKYLDIKVPWLGTGKDFIFFKNEITLAEHLPDMKVNDFLKAMQTRFNLAVYYNEQTKEVVMNYRNSIVGAATYTDLTSISSTPKISDITTLSGLLLKSEANEDDQFSQADALFTGTVQEDEINTKCKHLSQSTEIYLSFEDSFLVPVVSRSQEAKELILVFENQSIDSSQASAVTATADIDEPTDGYSYASLEAGQWDQYIRFLLNRKKATATINFELRHLLAIDFEKKYRIAGINYLINSIDVTLTMQGIQPATVELFTT